VGDGVLNWLENSNRFRSAENLVSACRWRLKSALPRNDPCEAPGMVQPGVSVDVVARNEQIGSIFSDSVTMPMRTVRLVALDWNGYFHRQLQPGDLRSNLGVHIGVHQRYFTIVFGIIRHQTDIGFTV
jgi:hypothetical protein